MENLKSAAKKIQESGQGGDTILAHINPQEAQLLKMMGGSGTINPETGLPEFKKVWKSLTLKNIVAAAPIIIAVIAPELAPAIGTSLGFSGTAATVAGNAVIGASQAAAQGKSPEDIAKSAVANVAGQSVGSQVGGTVSGAGAPQAISGAAGGAAGGATGAALTGGDVGKGATIGAITGGAKGIYSDITAPPAPIYDRSVYSDTLEPVGAEPVIPPEKSFLEKTATQAGKQLVGSLTGQISEGLYPTKSTAAPTSGTSQLASTGLFTPTSIVPTALTGIAPSARGKPILGGEDEEATGAWGAKTLRG